jgi:Xaa-Pro aminopeptidase
MRMQKQLTAAFFSSNRAKLRDTFGGKAPIVIASNGLMQKSADGAYPFTQDSNFWYLTGMNTPNLILVLDGSKEYIIAPEENAMQDIFHGATDRAALEKTSGIKSWYGQKEGWERLGTKLKKSKHVATIKPAPAFIGSLGMYVNPARAGLLVKIQSYNQKVDLIDLRTQLASLRVVKQPEEIEMIKQAFDQTVEMFSVISKKWAKVSNEQDLMAELEYWRVVNKSEFAYDPIIASGKNGLTLHYHSNNAPIDKKGFLLLDIGARAGGYCADITRSVVKQPTKRQQAVYDAVLAVHEFACSLLKPGTDLVTYEEAVLQFMGEKLRELGLIRTINKETVREFYPHATSHFLGIDTHDAGDHTSPLAIGSVLTVEPGIYIKEENIAIRLEDMLLITEDGNQILSANLIKKVDSLGGGANGAS